MRRTSLSRYWHESIEIRIHLRHLALCRPRSPCQSLANAIALEVTATTSPTFLGLVAARTVRSPHRPTKYPHQSTTPMQFVGMSNESCRRMFRLRDAMRKPQLQYKVKCTHPRGDEPTACLLGSVEDCGEPQELQKAVIARLRPVSPFSRARAFPRSHAKYSKVPGLLSSLDGCPNTPRPVALAWRTRQNSCQRSFVAH